MTPVTLDGTRRRPQGRAERTSVSEANSFNEELPPDAA